ncbi:hypothetical protein [Microbulbifer sp. JMSA008]|uniref:hypothetical protein n=1 Tax=Microbulbifer sp. JMSA008 TaxID=3243373 RepID=UPI0040394B9F
MRKSIIYWAATTIASLGSMNAISSEFVTGEIKRIFPSTSGEVRFRLKNDSCISGSQYYFFEMNENDPTGKYASKNWYSMLLASAMANKEVSINIESCPTSGDAKINYIFQDY